MKNLIKYSIIIAVALILFYIIKVLIYVQKYGVTPKNMREVIANEVYKNWLDKMNSYLFATKPTETDKQNITDEQLKWIKLIQAKANVINVQIDKLYSNAEYKKQVLQDLNYLARTEKSAILSNPNFKPFVNSILDSFGLDYRNPTTQNEFNKQFSKFVS